MSSSSIVQLIINHQAQVNSSFETLLSSARSILGVVGDSNTNISGLPQQMDPEHETQRSAGTTPTRVTVTTADAGDSGNTNANNGTTNQSSTGNTAAVAAVGATRVGTNGNLENGTIKQPSTPCFGGRSSNNENIEARCTTNQPPSVSPETSGTNMAQSNDDSTISNDGRYNHSNHRKRCNGPPSDSSSRITGEFICRFFNGSDEFHPPPTVDSSSSNKRTKIKQEQEV
mmetsp:Transcript_47991/g.116669  ORF Transcript_47991/g.116669 Transcript_47991/m.116669 type:complete len:229 (-) Transcript_47991:252-938(-)